jgi:predicted RecB family nuclease
MNVIGGRVVLSPTDLVGHLACSHLTRLELEAASQGAARPERVDAELDLLARRGEMHEQTQLRRMEAEGLRVAHVGDHAETVEGLRAAEAETLDAMRGGADVVYQAAFFDGRWRGRADFLLRVDTPSALGDWSYEVADAKLARSVKVSALLQMCEYSLHVARLQGVAPRDMHVLLGSGNTETHRVGDYAAYHRAARRRLEDAVDGPDAGTYPEPVDHCNVCRWLHHCTTRRRHDDHLSLVAGMRRDHTRRLRDAGIGTVAALAAAPAQRTADVGDAPWQRLRQQARLQMHERTTGDQTYELLTPERDGLGLAALPPPSAGDLFFDMEGDPFVPDGGLEYLFGAVELVDGTPRFHSFWAHDRTEEKAAFEALVDLLIDRLRTHPSLHVYHYASYEPAALKRLMGRHATREDEVDRLLRGGVLVDLYRVVTQGVRVSKDSYSIKKLEHFYMAERTEAIADAAASIVAYEQWLETRDPSLLDGIAAYNRRDCESTWMLRDWLEQRRDELIATGVAVERPQPRDAEPTEQQAAMAAETRELAGALTAGIPADASERTPRQRAQWLLGQLLDWHRREVKSEWWAYYARSEMSDEELVEDTEAIGSLVHVGSVRPDKRSTVHAYRFDAAQEHKLDEGDKPHDPRTQAAAGEIVAVDNDAGIVELKRGPSLDGAPHPTALMPPTPIPTPAMRQALRRVAEAVVAGGIDAPGRYGAVRGLLLQRTPRLRTTLPGLPLLHPGQDPVAATCALVADLDDSCLAVQGPPGCGKTFTGAHVIVSLVRAGRRVGVCATSHRAIGNLLSEVCQVAATQRQPVRILQKCEDAQACGAPEVRRAARNEVVAGALAAGEVDVVAGTPWLFADERLDGVLDVLVVDEAGQMSLANVCAVATAARNLVLLGDPQQLAQPSRGVHPAGAEVSALDHLLDGHDTIPEHRGVFLPATRRMHPQICRFISDAFYDGRLTSHPDTERQRVDGAGALHPTGTHIVTVDHSGNRTASPEEVRAVEALVEQLDGARWTEPGGVPRPLTSSDILVVAPYNAQVKRLRSALQGRALAGTVDRFQGGQAAVTVYSMATSSGEDMPRNLEFLFSRNRLNVAVSRARCVAVLVCAPELLRVRCRTPGQLRLVNALCRYAETAHHVEMQRMPAIHGV